MNLSISGYWYILLPGQHPLFKEHFKQMEMDVQTSHKWDKLYVLFCDTFLTLTGRLNLTYKAFLLIYLYCRFVLFQARQKVIRKILKWNWNENIHFKRKGLSSFKGSCLNIHCNWWQVNKDTETQHCCGKNHDRDKMVASLISEAFLLYWSDLPGNFCWYYWRSSWNNFVLFRFLFTFK